MTASKRSRPRTASPPRAAAPAPSAARRRSDGEKSHREILRAAADLASVEGLEGLSIASLAEHVGLSKSGLFAHFRSKEQLQLETIGAAAEIFQDEIVRPALAVESGLARVRSLVDGFLEHVRGRTFPGGCFFAAAGAELDSHPGVLRDHVAGMHRQWFGLFQQGVADAQARGDVDRGADPAQVAFEIVSMLTGGHNAHLLQGDRGALDRARRGVDTVLAAHGGRGSRR
jgi:AcrR family transcriptional regulator